MNIGVDAGCLGTTDSRLRVGVWQVVFNLLSELGKIGQSNQYWLYSFRPIPREIMANFGPKMKNMVVGPVWGWNYLGLPLSLGFHRPDVFLGPSQSLPFFCPCPALVIVHDLAFEIFPQFYPDSYYQLRRITRLAARKAKKIVAVSQATKNDLIRFYQVVEKKISVIPEGYDSQVFKPSRQKKATDYFLFVGALKRIKNIPGLLKGFKYFLDRSPRQFKLVLAGGDLWLDPQIQPTIKKLKLSDRVEILGHVATPKLVRFYQQATAFVSPSFYEGFGLTFLEAMACGCPVIGGQGGSQSEVVAQAGILVDPKNEKEIGRAMMQVVADSRLRRKMIIKGKRQAELFSWSSFAQQVLSLLTES